MNDNKKDFEKAWEMLKKNGMPIRDCLFIKKSFAEWGKNNLDDVDERFNLYVSKFISGYAFDKREHAAFLNALHKFSPTSNAEELISIIRIVSKLLDIDTGFNFR